MNRRLFGAFGVLTVIALSVGSCKSDPLSDADGNPAAVVTNLSYLQMPIGTTSAITATVLDARTTPLDVPITFTACTADVTVVEDTSYHPIPHTSERAIVTAVSAAPTCVRVSSGGIEDTVTISVLPQGFSGAFSASTLPGGDTLKIASTNLLKFNVATVAVTVGGAQATVIRKSVDTIQVLVPFGAAGPATISGVAVSYVPGLIVSLPTTNTITQTGSQWPGQDSWQTAPDLTSLIPATASDTTHAIVTMTAGNSAVCPEVLLDFGSAGPCAIFKFTLADSTRVRFRVNWTGTALAPDIDLTVCSDSTLANFDPGTGDPCLFEGFGGATGAKPQITNNRKYPPGTWWFIIENYDGTPSLNYFVDVIRLP
jgi:hypothetical protein